MKLSPWSANPHRLTLTAPNQPQLHFDLTREDQVTVPLTRSRGQAWKLCALRYQEDGNLMSSEDNVGRVLSFRYTTAGFLREVLLVKSPDGGRQSVRLVHYEHDVKGNLVAVYDRADKSTVYQYQGRSLITRYVNRLGGGCNAAYDKRGRCIYTWLDGGFQYRSLNFDDIRKTTTVINSDGARPSTGSMKPVSSRRKSTPSGRSRRQSSTGTTRSLPS